MCFNNYPPLIEPIYPNVATRKILFSRESPPQLQSWPQDFQSLEGLVGWLGNVFFQDKNCFKKRGLKLCGKQCVLISDDQLLAHHERWSQIRKPSPYVFKNKDGYLHVIIRSPPGVPQPKPAPSPIALHYVICWWCFGHPGNNVACHFACETKRCLCPRHLR
jgi:hypothetical protein